MQMEYLLTHPLFALSYYRRFMHSRSFTFEYFDAIGKVTIRFSQLNSICIEGGKVEKRKEMDDAKK